MSGEDFSSSAFGGCWDETILRGEQRSNAYPRQPDLKLKREAAIKYENILVDILIFDGFFWREVRYSQAKMAPDNRLRTRRD